MHKSYLNFTCKFCLCRYWGILRMNSTWKIMIASSLPHFADEEGQMFVFLPEKANYTLYYAFAHRVKKGSPQCRILHIKVTPFSGS